MNGCWQTCLSNDVGFACSRVRPLKKIEKNNNTMADNKEDRGPPPPPVSTVRISKNLAVDMDPVSALTTEQPSLVWARAVEVVVPPPIPVQHNAPPPADSASDAPPPDPARRESSPRRRKYIWILGLAGLTIVLLIIIVLYFASK